MADFFTNTIFIFKIFNWEHKNFIQNEEMLDIQFEAWFVGILNKYETNFH